MSIDLFLCQDDITSINVFYMQCSFSYSW